MYIIKAVSLGEGGGETLGKLSCNAKWVMIKSTRLGLQQRSKKLKEDEFGAMISPHFHRGSLSGDIKYKYHIPSLKQQADRERVWLLCHTLGQT